MNVLLVDDSAAMRRMVRDTLDVVGLEALEADNGQAAFDLLSSPGHDVGLIILDVEMPVMDGLTFLAKIKANHELAMIPVIMLTTVGAKEKVVQAIRTGAAHYLTKPFSSEDLLKKIIQVLQLPSFDDL